MLSNFRGEYLVLDVEGLNVDDDCYTWLSFGILPQIRSGNQNRGNIQTKI